MWFSKLHRFVSFQFRSSDQCKIIQTVLFQSNFTSFCICCTCQAYITKLYFQFHSTSKISCQEQSFKNVVENGVCQRHFTNTHKLLAAFEKRIGHILFLWVSWCFGNILKCFFVCVFVCRYRHDLGTTMNFSLSSQETTLYSQRATPFYSTNWLRALTSAQSARSVIQYFNFEFDQCFLSWHQH